MRRQENQKTVYRVPESILNGLKIKEQAGIDLTDAVDEVLKLAKAIQTAQNEQGLIDHLECVFSTQSTDSAERFFGTRRVIEYMQEMYSLANLSTTELKEFVQDEPEPEDNDDLTMPKGE